MALRPMRENSSKPTINSSILSLPAANDPNEPLSFLAQGGREVFF